MLEVGLQQPPALCPVSPFCFRSGHAGRQFNARDQEPRAQLLRQLAGVERRCQVRQRIQERRPGPRQIEQPHWLCGSAAAVIDAVVEAFGIEAADLAAVGHEPQAVAFDERRRADALQRPVVNSARRQLLAGVLPEETPVLFAKGEQAAEIDFTRGPRQIRRRVVRADKNFAAGDGRPAVGLAAQRRRPFHVASGPGQPRTRAAVELARVPVLRARVRQGHVVPPAPAAPLRPVAFADEPRLVVGLDQARAELSADHVGRLAPQGGQARVLWVAEFQFGIQSPRRILVQEPRLLLLPAVPERDDPPQGRGIGRAGPFIRVVAAAIERGGQYRRPYGQNC